MDDIEGRSDINCSAIIVSCIFLIILAGLIIGLSFVLFLGLKAILPVNF